jgi:hypothetical protein
MPRRLFGFVVLFAAVFMPNAADACTCFEQKVACEAAWDVDAVFVAQVVRVDRAGERDLRVHLMPLETLRGPSNILTVNTARSESECGYLFQAGETYLIYASAEAGGYGAGLCSRTRRLSEAADDLEYLRTVARTPSNFGVVRGTVWRTDRTSEARLNGIRTPVFVCSFAVTEYRKSERPTRAGGTKFLCRQESTTSTLRRRRGCIRSVSDERGYEARGGVPRWTSPYTPTGASEVVLSMPVANLSAACHCNSLCRLKPASSGSATPSLPHPTARTSSRECPRALSM